MAGWALIRSIEWSEWLALAGLREETVGLRKKTNCMSVERRTGAPDGRETAIAETCFTLCPPQ
jgi:hypothetical protein